MSDSLPPSHPEVAALSTERLDTLIARARAADGQPPFSDGSLIGLATGERELYWLNEGAAIFSRTEAEFVVDPDARGRGIGTALLEHLIARRPHELLVWAHGDHPAARALAAHYGLEPVRELWHMIGTVPAVSPPTGFASTEPTNIDTSIRGFRPSDAHAWLDLNARTFASYPDQGGVTQADLDLLMAEPWFNPDDFLLLRDERGFAAYCWLKIEADCSGAERGEFYVVGVAPERQGEGWGRRVVHAGLERLAARSIRSAQLYVDGSNEPAIRLYQSYGFERDSIDIQYRWSPH